MSAIEAVDTLIRIVTAYPRLIEAADVPALLALDRQIGDALAALRWRVEDDYRDEALNEFAKLPHCRMPFQPTGNGDYVPYPVDDWRAEMERVKAMLAAADADKPASEPDKAEDDSAFVPLSKLLNEAVPDYNAAGKFLKRNPWIRTRKPTPKARRRSVHAGDWHKAIAATDALDTMASAIDAVRDVESRKAEIDAAKGRK